MSHHTATTARWTAGFASALALLCSGCSSPSEIAGLLDANQAEATASAAHTNAAVASLALEASLNQIDSANFAPLTGPPSVTPTGTPTDGTVTIDFGVGTLVNNAMVSGTVMAAYTVSGSSVSITVTPSGLTTDTSSGGTRTLTGSMTLTGTLNGTSNITGSFSGTMTASGGGETTTITPSLTYAIDGTPTTGDITVDGTIGIDSSTYGDWTATLTSINSTVSQASRAINAGVLVMERFFILPITATMTFTGSNAGTIEINPSGFTRNFGL